MYEDSWYTYVPDSNPKNDEPASQSSNHRRRESLLKQPNVSRPTPNRDIANKLQGKRSHCQYPGSYLGVVRGTHRSQGTPNSNSYPESQILQ
ncbi:hypothetical protein WAI453_006779 [Rhynchosporium graminicola]